MQSPNQASMHHPGRNHLFSNPDIIQEDEAVNEYPMPNGFFSDRHIDRHDKQFEFALEESKDPGFLSFNSGNATSIGTNVRPSSPCPLTPDEQNELNQILEAEKSHF